MPDNKAIVRRLLETVWSKGQLTVIEELISKDFVGYWPLRPEPVRGPADYKEFVSETRHIFPDLSMRILEEIGEGEIVASRFEVTSTQRGEFLTIPPTNKKLTVECLAFSRVLNGKIVETHVQMDVFKILCALGVVSDKMTAHAHTVTH